MYLNACTASNGTPPAIPPDPPAAPRLLMPQAGWMISYPVGRSASRDAGANPSLGTMLNLHMALDLKFNGESVSQALAIIGTTITGRMLLNDLAHRLNGQHISVVQAAEPHQAGVSAGEQGELQMGLYADTLLSHGSRMRAYSGRAPFSAQQQYACGLFEFLLTAINHLERGTPMAGQNIHLHPQTATFRQALLDAARQPQHAGCAAAPLEPAPQPRVGLRVTLDSGMQPYADGFHDMMTTVRGIDVGSRMLQGFAQAIGTPNLVVYHVDHPGDAGIFADANTVYWCYNVGALAAHAALLQTSTDDLAHKQRDACAAFDLLIKSWESIQQGHIKTGDRLDLDYGRRCFRDDLIGDLPGNMNDARPDGVDGMRV